MIPLVMSVIAKTETFQRNMAKAGKSVKTFSTTTSRTTATITKLGRSMMMMTGVGGGLFMMQRGIRKVISASIEQEKVERQLTAALSSTGDATRANIEDLKRYAAGLQKVTIYGDEQILSQMAYGINLGITTGKLEEATKAAVGLAAKYRLDLKAAMMLVGRASQGQTQMLTRYGIVLDETLSPQEKFNELLKMGAANFQLAKDETDTLSGAWEQLRNASGDLAEAIGMPLLPALTDAAKKMTTVATEAQKVENAMNRIIAVAAAYKDAMMWFYRKSPTMWPMRQGLGLLSSPITEKPSLLPASERMGIMPESEETALNRRLQELGSAGADPAKDSAAAEAAEKAAASRVQITARMYSDMGQYGDGYHQAQVAMLDLQKADYAQHVNDKVLLEKWYAGGLEKIQEEMRVSSLDAMGQYHEELKADMQNTSLYISEKFTEAARTIEGSMSNAFQSMITDGASWKDAMSNFFKDTGAAFAKMASDMLARWMMLKIVGAVAGAVGGGGPWTGSSWGQSPNYSTTGPTNAGADPYYYHKGWVPEGVPSFQRGRGLKPNEMVAVIEKDELLAPNKQVVKSSRGNGQDGGTTINIDTYVERIDATDAASFDAQLYRSRHTLGDLQVMNKKSNHPGRRIDKK